jgi:UDP-2-acetamido-2,6-beta-L-arabino-hexul-4-ose reductase
MLRVLITGSNGFVAQNLIHHLKEFDDIEIITLSKEKNINDVLVHNHGVNCVFHLAGVNRTDNNSDFKKVNQGLTQSLCDLLTKSKRKIPIIFSSSTQVKEQNDYGRSKLSAEKIINEYSKITGSSVYIYRFPGLFGKWCKPYYNSVVATFCNNVANNLPIEIRDSEYEIKLMYIDDVINEFLSVLFQKTSSPGLENIPLYKISLGKLAEKIYKFHDSRKSLVVDKVGRGFTRALYSTYMSYIDPKYFVYDLDFFSDDRGLFLEILKTQDSGQFSFFTSNPGEVRGEHYHHTKNEKFIVVSGKALFKFRNIKTNKEYSVSVNSKKFQVVETVPGWAHNITNVGDSSMLVFLWANEVYIREESDTYPYKLNHE